MKIKFNKEVTFTAYNSQINLDVLYDLAFFKDVDGLYYEYTLFTLADFFKTESS